MSADTLSVQAETIVYPERDGLPMADNTLQFRWIVTIVEGLRALFRDDPNVFIAGDLLWYPVEGAPQIRRAPDGMVAFGRPRGDRGSYLQWIEDDIPPQVVFEVLSPGNTLVEMGQKFEFYDLYGVEEYYLYDPRNNDLSGWLRRDGRLRIIENIEGWTSPRLGVRFELDDLDFRIIRPDGERFLTYEELDIQRREEQAARAQAEQWAQQEQAARKQAEQRAEDAEQRAAQFAARLRAMGIDPDTME
jgi:Uma2 family endonuclease